MPKFSEKDAKHTVEYADALKSLQVNFLEFSDSCDEAMANLGLFLTPQERRRELFLYEVYKLILDKPGSIAQFGVRWGRELALLESFRTIFEPFNHSRRILVSIHSLVMKVCRKKMDSPNKWQMEIYLLATDTKNFLKRALTREALSPVSQYKKFQLIAGDVGTR